MPQTTEPKQMAQAKAPFPVDGVNRLGERPEPGRGGLRTSQGEPARPRR